MSQATNKQSTVCLVLCLSSFKLSEDWNSGFCPQCVKSLSRLTCRPCIHTRCNCNVPRLPLLLFHTRPAVAPRLRTRYSNRIRRHGPSPWWGHLCRRLDEFAERRSCCRNLGSSSGRCLSLTSICRRQLCWMTNEIPPRVRGTALQDVLQAHNIKQNGKENSSLTLRLMAILVLTHDEKQKSYIWYYLGVKSKVLPEYRGPYVGADLSIICRARYTYMLSPVRPPSHGWISQNQKRLKLGSCNFHRRVAQSL